MRDIDDGIRLIITRDVALDYGNVRKHPDGEYYLPTWEGDNTWATADAEDFETVSIATLVNEFSKYNLELGVSYYQPHRNSLKVQAGFDVKQNGISVAELWNDDRNRCFFIKMIRPDGSREKPEDLDCDLRTSLKKLCDKLQPQEKNGPVSADEALKNRTILEYPGRKGWYLPSIGYTWSNANDDDFSTVIISELDDDYSAHGLTITEELLPLPQGGSKKTPSRLNVLHDGIFLGDLRYNYEANRFVSRVFKAGGEILVEEETLDSDLQRSLAKLIGKLDAQKKDIPEPIEHKNVIRSVEEILPERDRIEQKFGVKIRYYGDDLMIEVNKTGRKFQMKKVGESWQMYDIVTHMTEYLSTDFEKSLIEALQLVKTEDRKKSWAVAGNRMAIAAMAAGVIALAGVGSKLAFDLGNNQTDTTKTPETPPSEFGNWSQRHFVGLPDGEAAAKELQSAHAKAIFVITCGQRGDDPKSIVATSYIAYPDDAPIPVQGDTTVSHFEGYEEVLPHPLKVCRNADAGTTWSYPLVKVTQ